MRYAIPPRAHVVFRGILAALTLCVGGIATGQERVILTPKPAPTPRINGAKVFGVRPGHPFLFTIPATGQRPMQFAVDDLPAGLKVDPQTGKSPARSAKRGEYVVTFRAKNALGEAERVQDRLRRHAGPDAADGLEPLVRALRTV